MSLTQYADITAQNLGWIIATGVAVFLLFFFTFIVSLCRKVSRQQKELERLSEDVAALRLMEETRFFTELSPHNANDAREAETPRRGGNVRALRYDGGAQRSE